MICYLENLSENIFENMDELSNLSFYYFTSTEAVLKYSQYLKSKIDSEKKDEVYIKLGKYKQKYKIDSLESYRSKIKNLNKIKDEIGLVKLFSEIANVFHYIKNCLDILFNVIPDEEVD